MKLGAKCSMKKICVIGSFNIDLVSTVDAFPKVGETIIANSFEVLIGGGKGANQATALGRLGADVKMVGKLGDMFFGPKYLQVLKSNGVDCSTVGMEKNQMPGSAYVSVDKNGDNILIINPGTNAMVDIAFIDKHWEEIVACDIFLFQLEIPLETNIYLMERLSKLDKILIFDPAPAQKIPEQMFEFCDYVTPNETELEAFTGILADTAKEFKRAGKILIGMGAKTVIAKAGKKGAYLISKDSFEFVPCFKVDAVDPTAAGDCFNSGFAFKLANGELDIVKCIYFAHAVAGISTTALGAQSAMPSLFEVNEFLKSH